MSKMLNYYNNLFTDTHQQKIYIQDRHYLYMKLYQIAVEQGMQSVIDIGCGFGLFVEQCNARGMQAYGLDFPIQELQRFHADLKYSVGKFIYGSIEDDSIVQVLYRKDIDLITIIDTLRHISQPQKLATLRPKMFIIKEVSCNPYMKHRRRNQHDVQLYTPLDLLHLFSAYRIERIYPSKFFTYIDRPNLAILHLVNFVSPAYTILLQRI